MPLDFDAFSSDALALPPEQRMVLAQRLWESIEGQIDNDEELFEEMDRREAEIASGAVKPIPYDRAMREIRSGLIPSN